MNAERVKELMPILQAFAEGKPIQGMHKGVRDGRWRDVVDTDFSTIFEYRIKPEPREGWVALHDLCLSKEQAQQREIASWGIMRVREVID